MRTKSIRLYSQLARLLARLGIVLQRKRVLICALLYLNPFSVAFADTLTIGTISDEPVKETRVYLPLAQYLASKLGTFGIDRGGVRIARSVEEMAELFGNGSVDLYIDSPLIAAAINQVIGGELLLRRWKKGQAEYRAVIFVRTDSGIENLLDLNGKTIAFEEPFSSSGYLLPRMSLAESGLTVVEERLSRPKKNQVNYRFSSDDENTLFWVLRDRVDAGAMSRATFDTLSRTSAEHLRVIAETEAIPRHTVNVRPGLNVELTSAISRLLTSMEFTAEGRKILKKFERTTRFDPIPEASIGLLKQYGQSLKTILELE